ncbi:MAG: malonyl-ACP O-methyltransferase BioC [Pseudomonadales bacterium]|nr:malonyl-ACP O-methyltransferase BioC [Pseudomonadales bacterium]
MSAANVEYKVDYVLNAPRSMDDILDKRLVASSFSRAADTYNAAAHLQKAVATNLMKTVDAVGWRPERCANGLDMGTGTGYMAPVIKQYFGVESLIALDLAEGMLNFGQRQSDCRSAVDGFVCADIENLPFAASQFDLIFSSLAVQWCHALSRVIEQVADALKPGGTACLSTLLQGTLHELQSAWSVVDGFQHVNQFLTIDAVKQILVNAKGELFQDFRVVQETRELQYDSVRNLSRELKDLGAHNVTPKRSTHVTGKQRIRALQTAYEHYRMANGKLPATYNVCYILLKK